MFIYIYKINTTHMNIFTTFAIIILIVSIILSVIFGMKQHSENDKRMKDRDLILLVSFVIVTVICIIYLVSVIIKEINTIKYINKNIRS
jgi:Na+/H+ antiporter NhaC